MSGARSEEARARLIERIAAVRSRFVSGLGDRTRTLSELARRAGASGAEDAPEARDALRMGLHNLAGAAPTLGLQALGRRAAELEARVIAETISSGGLNGEAVDAIAADVAELANFEG